MVGSTSSHESGQRRQLVRVRADLRVVVGFEDGHKEPARVLDVSMGGMNLRASRVPEYGKSVIVIVQLRESGDWHVIPSVVRWFSRGDFGVAFENLNAVQARALAAFVHDVAA